MSQDVVRMADTQRADIWLHRMIVGGLMATLMMSAVGTVVLAYLGREPPPGLQALSGTALGALAALAQGPSFSRRTRDPGNGNGKSYPEGG
jgi:hypothetical protein